MLEKLNVLLIEDEVLTQTLLGTVIRNNGYNVSIASNYDDAFKAWRNISFDLIVSDYFLEGSKTGVDFLQDIRSESSSVPAIALSYAENSETIDLINKAGFDFYLKKPVDVRVFSTALTKLLAT
ncbi:response regulator [Thalassospira lucentensis]|uniref:response regulator n=1 Tax=Thalassospira lucentensis TaxID=168935 RepID=UPI003D2ED6DB